MPFNKVHRCLLEIGLYRPFAIPDQNIHDGVGSVSSIKTFQGWLLPHLPQRLCMFQISLLLNDLQEKIHRMFQHSHRTLVAAYIQRECYRWCQELQKLHLEQIPHKSHFDGSFQQNFSLRNLEFQKDFLQGNQRFFTEGLPK